MALHIDESFAQHALNEVKRLREAFILNCLDSKATQRSVEGLLDICRKDLAKEILVHEHPDTNRIHLVQSIYLSNYA